MNQIRKRILIVGLVIVALIFFVWVVWDNTRIAVTELEVKSERLPDGFDGYRIVHVSDLHNDEFGTENKRLLKRIKEEQPDMIAITGDLLDSRRTDVEKALNFAKKAAEIAPCYYVTGNHESRQKEGYAQLEMAMKKAGVIVLRNETLEVEHGGDVITIAGMDDPRFTLTSDRIEKMEREMGNVLSKLLQDVPKERFTLLLSHRPELFRLYGKQKLDLVLSGHVHGGQFRIPGIGGIVGPGQGLLPDYDAGLYQSGNTNMVLSRGLGQSIVPFRINNSPELVVVILRQQ